MAKTSFHLKPCDLVNSEAHNRRTRKFDYVREDLSNLNESHSYIEHSLQKEHSRIKKEVKEKTGRKLQKNAIPIKEGVIVIKDDTSMEDIKRFCAKCEDRWGIVPLQIHMHKDEGHWKGKEWIPNLHAHIVWRMYNREGRNCRIKNVDCSEMQTIAAEVLCMERGKASDKKHLSAMEYKIQQQEQRIEELESELKGKNVVSEKLRGAYEGAKDKFTGKERKRAEEAERIAAENLRNAEKNREYAERLKDEAEALKSTLVKANKALSKANEKIEQSQWAVNNVERLRDENRKAKEFLRDSARLGLTAKQMVDLQESRKLSCDQIETSGRTITRTDNKPIHLRLKDGIIEVLDSIQWQRVAEWCRNALQGAWYAVNGVSNESKQNRGLGL